MFKLQCRVIELENRKYCILYLNEKKEHPSYIKGGCFCLLVIFESAWYNLTSANAVSYKKMR